MKWSEVKAQDKYINLPPEEQAKVRETYFDKYLAPVAQQKGLNVDETRAVFHSKNIPQPIQAEGGIVNSPEAGIASPQEIVPEKPSLSGISNKVLRLGKVTENLGAVINEGIYQTGQGLKLIGIDSIPDGQSAPNAQPKNLDEAIQQNQNKPGLFKTALNIGARIHDEFAEQSVADKKQQAYDETVAKIKDSDQRIADATPEDLTFVEESVRSGLESLALNAPPAVAGIATTLLTKSPAIGTAVSSSPLIAKAGIDARTEARLAGMESEAANLFGMKQGGIEAAFEIIPDFMQNKLFKDAVAKKGTKVKDFLKTFATEMVGEQATTAYQDINSYLHDLDKEMANPSSDDVPEWMPDWLKNSTGLEKQIWLRAQRQAATAIATFVSAGAQQSVMAGGAAIVEGTKTKKLGQQALEDVENAAFEKPDAEAIDALNPNKQNQNSELGEQVINPETGELLVPDESHIRDESLKLLPAPGLYVDKKGNVTETLNPKTGNSNTGLTLRPRIVAGQGQNDSYEGKTGQELVAEQAKTRWLKIDGELAAKSRDARLPNGLKDPRLLRSDFIGELGRMANSLEKGGGITVLPNEDGRDYGGKRTKSSNPDWYKNLDENTKLTTNVAKIAVKKALNGEDLGVREARFVTAMLNEITDERVHGAPMDYAKEKFEKYRDLKKEINLSRIQNGIDMLTGKDVSVPSELDSLNSAYDEYTSINNTNDYKFEEENYRPDLAEDGRALAELLDDVNQSGMTKDEVHAIVDQHVNDKDIAGLTQSLINAVAEKRNGRTLLSKDSKEARGGQASDPNRTSHVASERVAEESTNSQNQETGSAEKTEVETDQAGKEKRPVTYSKDAVIPKNSRGNLTQPHDYNVGLAREKAKKYAEHIPQEIREEFLKDQEPEHVVDNVTGFYKAEDRVPALNRAKEYLKTHRHLYDTGVYIEIDISNLGGLNDAKGHEGADQIYKGITDIVSNELDAHGAKKQDYEQINFRHGGDEFSFILVGTDQAAAEQAMERAKSKVQEYIKSEGLADLPHAKDVNDLGRRGVGIEFGTSQILPEASNSKIFSDADVRVEERKRAKKTVKGDANEHRSQNETDSRIQQESGQSRGRSDDSRRNSEYGKKSKNDRRARTQADAEKSRSSEKYPLDENGTTADIDAAANEAATSDNNNTPKPTEAQKDVGNYKKGHVKFQGLDIAIENPKDSYREGVDKKGKKWRNKLNNHYGYIKGTEGNDGDHVDVFLGGNEKSTTVFIFNQVDPKTRKFDEHKVMLGFDMELEAIDAYQSNYARDWEGRGTTATFTMDEFKSWLENHDTTKPVEPKVVKKVQAESNSMFDEPYSEKTSQNNTETTKPKKENKSAEEIIDVGEALTWNKKNRWKSGLTWEEVKDENDTLRTKLIAKENIWEKPNWAEIIESVPEGDRAVMTFIARMVKSTYDALPAAPQGKSDEAAQNFINSITAVKKAAQDLLADRQRSVVTLQAIVAKIPKSASYGRPVDILSTFGESDSKGKAHQPLFVALFPQIASGKRWNEVPEESKLSSGLSTKGFKALQWSTADAVKAAKDIELGFPAKKELWQVRGYKIVKGEKLDITFYRSDDVTNVNLKNGIRTLISKTFSGSGREFESTQYAEALKQEIASQYVLIDKAGRLKNTFNSEEEAKKAAREATKTIKQDKPNIERDQSIEWDDAKRDGVERRLKGQNISAEDLQNAFGFKGVNFGNWVNQSERQSRLNGAYDAFADLADVLGIPPKAIGLEGKVGMAFGAQGSGTFAAHFVAGVNEINLTKTRGAGALAHEWAHALDHHLGTLAGMGKSSTPFVSSFGSYFRHSGENKARKEILEAVENIVAVMKKRDETKEESTARKQNELNYAENNIKEFEKRKQLREKLKGDKKALESLENIYAGNKGELIMLPPKKGKRKSPGHVGKEIFAIYEKAGLTDVDALLLHRAASSLEYAKDRLADDDNSVRVHTRFYKVSSQLDGGSKKPYWTSNHELFARAFESWVFDKLAAKQAQNDFLVSPYKSNDVTVALDYPYPTGVEREIINAAFDKLIDILEVQADNNFSISENNKGYLKDGIGSSERSSDGLRSQDSENTRTGDDRTHGGVLGNYVALGIAKEIRTAGVAALVGRSISTPKELAELAQIYRNPQYETIRYFFTKGNRIVHATGVSSRLPGHTAHVPKKFAHQDTVWIQAQMELAGADGFWMLHNHPSGNPEPSRGDIGVTKHIAEDIKGFKGHVIINSNKYAYINKSGVGKVKSADFGEDQLLKPSIPSAYLKASITSPQELSRVGKSLQKDGYFVLIGKSGLEGVRAIIEIDVPALIHSKSNAKKIVKDFALNTGSSQVFIYGQADDVKVLGAAHELIRGGYVVDIVSDNGDSWRNLTNPDSNLAFGVNASDVGEEVTDREVIISSVGDIDSEFKKPKQGVLDFIISEETVSGVFAYHGTPHEVDKFSSDKIGTGEGAQSYGYGLYFAEEKEVAVEYRNNLSYPPAASDVARDIKIEMESYGSRNMVDRIESGKYDKWFNDEAEKNNVLNWMKGEKGNLYKVELKINPDTDLLDWDKPIDDDKARSIIRQALKTAPVDESKQFHRNILAKDIDNYSNFTGAHLYQTLSMGVDKHTLTRAMIDSGFKGIRYLDKFSRSKEGDTRNFVIFDDALIDIIEENGISVSKNIGAKFKRSVSTKNKYEQRINELFDGKKPNLFGIKMLDSSDILGLLGVGDDKSVHLVEGKVVKGRHLHNLSKEDWKKVPDWLENPAAVFDSDTVQGRVVVIAPETIGDKLVRMIIEPAPDKKGVNLFVNAYEAERSPTARWVEDGLLKYTDEKIASQLERSGLRLPRLSNLKGYKQSIYTGVDLFKYRRSKDDKDTVNEKRSPDIGAMTVSDVKSAMSDVVLSWKDAPVINVVADTNALPDSLKKADPQSVAFTLSNGSIYIIANKMKDKQHVLDTLAHEAVGHYGMEAIMGDAYEELLDKVQWLKTNDGRVKELAEEIAKSYPETKNDAQLESAEIIAHLAEEVVNGNLSTKAKDLINSVKSSIKDWLRSKGFNIKFTESDLRSLIRSAARKLRTGEIGLSKNTRLRKNFVSKKDDGSDTLTGSWLLRDENRLQGLQRKAQDKFNRFSQVQDVIKKSGNKISDDANVYRAEELYHGKVEEELRKFQQSKVEPLIKGFAEKKITIEELDDFLYAKFAPERNAHIKEINPKFEDDGGSGMTDAEAKSILAQVEKEGRTADFNYLANLVYAINNEALDLSIASGMQDADTAQLWRNKYKHYVPLKGRKDIEDKPKTGKGFNLKGKALRALGRESRAESPLLHSMAQAEETIIRAEKAKVGQSLLDLVREHPNEDVWEIITVPAKQLAKPVFNKRSGQVVVGASPLWKMDEDIVVVKRGGKDYHIKIHDKRLSEAFQNLGVEQLGFFSAQLTKVTRTLAAMNTSLNPEFVISNALRDMQTAIFHLAAEEGKGNVDVENLKTDVMKSWKASWSGILQQLRAESKGVEAKDTKWTRAFKDFRDAGGKVGFYDFKDIDGRKREIASLLEEAKGGKTGKLRRVYRVHLKNGVSDLNGAVENALRVSVFEHLRNGGMTDEQAASVAKNLTVNFNRKGEWGAQLNAFYMFYNASVQGSTQFARAMTSPKARKYGAIIVAFSMANSILQRMFAGEDDDGENLYDVIPEWKKERNFIVMNPFGETKGDYFSVPLPYGYNVFYVAGDNIAAVSYCHVSPGKAALNILGAAADSFNPLGSASSDEYVNKLVKFLSPTALDPFVEIGFNENFFGSWIYKENDPYGAELPDSSRSMKGTSKIYKDIAENFNTLTGGDSVHMGWIDVSPDSIEHLVNFALGGAGAFADRSMDAVYKGVAGEDISKNKIPFLRKVYGEKDEYRAQSTYYENIERIKLAIEARESQRAKPLKDRKPLREEDRILFRIQPRMKQYQASIKILKDLKRSAERTGNNEKIKRYDEKIQEKQNQFNKLVNEKLEALNK